MAKTLRHIDVDPFDLGYEAHQKGFSPKKNPFRNKDADAAASWAYGWECREKEQKELDSEYIGY